MTKNEYVQQLAARANITPADAERVVDAQYEIIGAALQAGEEVNLPPLGKFKVKERAARKGRNPQTGEVIDIAATRVPVFKPGKNLEARVK